MSDLYRVLGVGTEASQDEINDAYEHLKRDSEPTAPWASTRIAEIEHAYSVLSSPTRRAAYDAGAVNPASVGNDRPSGALPPPLIRSEPSTYAPREDAPSREPLPWDLPPPPPREPMPRGRPMRHRSRNPVDRLTGRLPRPWRVAIDWIVTIAGAIAIVLAIKAWVVNPYRIPSSSMEPTLHCAKNGGGCLARFSDRVLANRFIFHFRKPRRGDIIVFETPPNAQDRCGAAGTFVKRLIGLPGETIEERLIRGRGYIFINGKRLKEPYLEANRRDTQTYPPTRIKPGHFFMMGDNRSQSCDSREWGPVPRANLIGEVFFIYWPPNRIGFAALTLLVGTLVPLAFVRRLRRRS